MNEQLFHITLRRIMMFLSNLQTVMFLNPFCNNSLLEKMPIMFTVIYILNVQLKKIFFCAFLDRKGFRYCFLYQIWSSPPYLMIEQRLNFHEFLQQKPSRKKQHLSFSKISPPPCRSKKRTLKRNYRCICNFTKRQMTWKAAFIINGCIIRITPEIVSF